MHINQNMDEQYLEKTKSVETKIKIATKTEIENVNMDNIEESSLFLDASVSGSIVEVQYDHTPKHSELSPMIRSRMVSHSITDCDVLKNMAILEEDDMVNDIIIAVDDEN